MQRAPSHHASSSSFNNLSPAPRFISVILLSLLAAKFWIAPASSSYAPGVPSSSSFNNLGPAPSFNSVILLPSLAA
jgi:hypothetical protein